VRTRTDKIGGTDIACNLYGQAVHEADTTKLSERPPTCRRDAGDRLDKYAGLVRTRRPCDLTLFCSADTDFIAACTLTLTRMRTAVVTDCHTRVQLSRARFLVPAVFVAY
jgi:hypothetical protein